MNLTPVTRDVRSEVDINHIFWSETSLYSTVHPPLYCCAVLLDHAILSNPRSSYYQQPHDSGWHTKKIHTTHTQKSLEIS